MALSSRLSNTVGCCNWTPRLSHARLTHPIRTNLTQKRTFTQSLTSPLQIYRSTSTDPYLNLSIEHHLLQRSHPDSTILFLYANRPSVVIGRNQNPWLEVNLHLLRQGLPPPTPNDSAVQQEDGAGNSPIALVRRRSGGGTVFHDAGNVNYSVICPPAVFDRDRHAEMVVRALQSLGVSRARVNERHDIVVDVDARESGVQTFKVSGSAYKLTRTRSLHHGTCLLSSPNLGRVSALLRSPAEGLIKARGVESVRSKIRNVGLGGGEFVEAVEGEFRKMYGEGAGRAVLVGEEDALATEEVVKGLRELTSPDWIFGQTPQFSFSTRPTEEDPRERPSSVEELPYGFEAHLTFRHGEIQSAALSGLSYHDFVDEAEADAGVSQKLVKQRLHYIKDWRRTLKAASPASVDTDDVGDWLNRMFGIAPPVEKGGNGGSVAETFLPTLSDAITSVLLNTNFTDST